LVTPGDAGDGVADDDLRPGDPDAGERLAGRGTAVGTLVHDAVARISARSRMSARGRPPAGGRTRSGDDELTGLAGQEVLFPFPADARAAILAEVEARCSGDSGIWWRRVRCPDLGARTRSTPSSPSPSRPAAAPGRA
jgi:hypothetical protein